MTTGPKQGVLDWARRVQAIAQTGLAFTQDPFDRVRYEQLQQLVTSILTSSFDLTETQAVALWANETGYATPKVDTRGGVFDEDRVLLVRERSDGKWTLPGGWVDINDSPSTAVEREIREESGYTARAVKLAAVLDRNRHPHTPNIYHIWKLFFVCERTGGAPASSIETDGAEFFSMHALPELSTGRVTAGQIQRLYEHRLRPELPTDFD